jgi:iron complex outermembrane receptor protein
MKNRTAISLALGALLLTNSVITFAEEIDYFSLPLEELLEIKVTSASGISESILEAPAAIVVIDKDDIAQKGYNNIAELVSDLPGFDVVNVSGASGKINAYQRGYRTPFTARTLLLIDGVVENNLWSQQLLLGPQYAISSIEKVEVLYGPASVLYGANAFLGIINIITKKGSSLADNEDELTLRAEIGSWQSRGGELHARGHHGEFDYSITGRVFHSDEENLVGRWGFISNEMYGNKDIWGPMLQERNNGMNYGQYNNDTDDWSILANAGYGNWQLGIHSWSTDEGYGPQFAADRGQSNSDWQRSNQSYSLKHNAQYNDKTQIKTALIYRENQILGDWVEAEPDWRAGMEAHAFISRTQWNSTNDALELKQDINLTYSDDLQLMLGWRYKKSDLTKHYDIAGYWAGSFNSGTSAGETGPYGFGPSIYHSTDTVYDFLDKPKSSVPSENRVKFSDQGVYLGSIYDSGSWRFNLGLRYDDNKIWGSALSPRASAVYKFNNQRSAIKLVYGEAFQEPAAKQLYGGWSGRKANPDLLSEEAQNIELILQHQDEMWLHDISLYLAKYNHVIRENADNDANRNIWGFEYRGKFDLSISNSILNKLSGHLYYTYTKPETDQTYDHSANNGKGDWMKKTSRLGDIAPHKINLSLDWPIIDNWHLNINTNFYSRTALYSRNPLTIKNVKVGSRVILDSSISYKAAKWQTFFKVLNIFDREVLAPGINNANSGDDFSQRSKGYDNSLLPQPGRSFWLTTNYTF